MTTAPLNHLRAIDAHLARLLDIAAKRTPRRWVLELPHPDEAQVFSVSSFGDERPGTLADCCNYSDEQDKSNAAFIASCAGNAEAGWIATRAAIARTLRMYETIANITEPSMSVLAIKHELHQQTCDILAAFPLESIKP